MKLLALRTDVKFCNAIGFNYDNYTILEVRQNNKIVCWFLEPDISIRAAKIDWYNLSLFWDIILESGIQEL